ncbi:MAG: serine hydrolase domain-containing protein [Myxococcota bacterium]
MLHRFTLLLVAAVVAGCERPPVEVPVAPGATLPLTDRPGWAQRRQRLLARVPQVERAVDAAVRKEGYIGAAAAVVVDGQLLWGRGYGRQSIRGGGPIDPRSVFRVGSVTKVITAMAILRLRDEGRLELDRPAAVWIPEFDAVRAPTADSGPITLRQLLTHTAGLPKEAPFAYGPRGDGGPSEGEVVAGLDGLALAAVPGTKHIYANYGYALLGLIVGRASGMRYRDYVDTYLLAPLGMQDSRWDRDAVPEGQQTAGHRGPGGGREPGPDWEMGAAEGMGGLYASLDDLVRFAAFQMSAWPPGTRPDLEPLRNASLRESHRLAGFQALNRQGTGIGWGVAQKAGSAVAFHAGETGTYSATVTLHLDRRLAFVTLANCPCSAALSRVEAQMLSALSPAL